jgi:beta-1,4-mannosyltransferase
VTVRRALVIVQGDLGRSPRMQYHAYALAVNGVVVNVVGLAGAAVAPAVASHPAIRCYLLADTDRDPVRHVVRTTMRLTSQSIRLAARLTALERPDLVLVQTPPTIPSNILAWAKARQSRARFIIDWHNIGSPLLALDGAPTWARARVDAIERGLARRADGHLAVSRGLADHLAARVNVRASVLYDRPPEWMIRAPPDRATAMRRRLLGESDRQGEPSVLIVSPTSWTRDEDTHMIVEAADMLDDLDRAAPGRTPPVTFVVSGRGPGRAAFEARLHSRPQGTTRIHTTWVEPEAYPSLLSAADAGVSLHRSASGLDLPMKIADMFGVGLPILALDYPALAERIRPGEDVATFRDARSLAGTVVALWSGGAAGEARLRTLRAASADAGRERWLDGWTREARPLLLGNVNG